MRALVQRVQKARVTVADECVGAIGWGLVLLAGFRAGDDDPALRFCADKCAHLRIFADAEGRMNRSVLEVAGQALVVPQFTLYADCRRGRRPSFNEAAEPLAAAALYERFLELCAQAGMEVARGRFGAHMILELTNDGPVTVMVESP
jgi:D-aminoacyl-tRNA deacylase